MKKGEKKVPLVSRIVGSFCFFLPLRWAIGAVNVCGSRREAEKMLLPDAIGRMTIALVPNGSQTNNVGSFPPQSIPADGHTADVPFQ